MYNIELTQLQKLNCLYVHFMLQQCIPTFVFGKHFLFFTLNLNVKCETYYTKCQGRVEDVLLSCTRDSMELHIPFYNR